MKRKALPAKENKNGVMPSQHKTIAQKAQEAILRQEAHNKLKRPEKIEKAMSRRGESKRELERLNK